MRRVLSGAGFLLWCLEPHPRDGYPLHLCRELMVINTVIDPFTTGKKGKFFFFVTNSHGSTSNFQFSKSQLSQDSQIICGKSFSSHCLSYKEQISTLSPPILLFMLPVVKEELWGKRGLRLQLPVSTPLADLAARKGFESKALNSSSKQLINSVREMSVKRIFWYQKQIQLMDWQCFSSNAVGLT